MFCKASLRGRRGSLLGINAFIVEEVSGGNSVAVDEAWADSAWPWLSSLARSTGANVPAGAPSAVISDLLLSLADAAEKMDATANAYVLTYLIAVLQDGGTLQENQESLLKATRRIDASASPASVDQLASAVANSVQRLRAMPDLSYDIREALERCPRTPIVLDCLDLLDELAAPPPPPPIVVDSELASATRPDNGEHAMGETAGSSSAHEGHGDPWLQFCTAHPVDSIIQGRVAGTREYGAFINLGPGIDGLVHRSEVLNPQGHPISDIVRVGQRVAVKVIKLDEGRRRISLSMKDVPQTSIRPDDFIGQDEGQASDPQDRRFQDSKVFMEAAKLFLTETSGKPRPLLREMARIRGNRIYDILKGQEPRKARDIASALVAALVGWALTRSLTSAQIEIVRLAGRASADRQMASVINGLAWASNDGLVPTPIQVRKALAEAGSAREEVRDLVVCGLVRALTRALREEDVTKASDVVDVAVELGAELPQSKAGELVDLLSSMNLPTTTSLKFGELRDRADPANRPDLAVITDPEDRRTLLAALPMLQAQIAVEVARKNRDELLAQALMWLAQQLGDSIKQWMPPRTRHPAVAAYEQEQRQPRRSGRSIRDAESSGLRREVVARAVAGEAAAARQAAKALESFLRTSDPVAEEWDAYLDATLSRLSEAASTWRKIESPSPEVSWNLAMFEATQPFTRHLAWRPLEHALSTYQSNPQTALHALYHAIKALTDASASEDAMRASREFVIRWGPEVPDGNLLLASLSLMEVETEADYNGALDAFSQWQILEDPPALQPSIIRRNLAETKQRIQELRQDNRYSRRWLLLILCGAADSPDQRSHSVLSLNAACEVAEQLAEDAIVRSAYERAVEIALDEHSHARAGTEVAVRKTFEETCLAALTFARKTGDQRLARQVRSALNEAGGEWSNKTNGLVIELLGKPEDGRVQRRTITDQSVSVEPALAELAQPFNAVQTPSDLVRLNPRMMSALRIVRAPEETTRPVNDVMAGFDRLTRRVGIREARDLLQDIAGWAEELEAKHGRSGDNSLAAMLKAVERARTFAANQIEDAPSPDLQVAPGWRGVAMESERAQLVLSVTAPEHDDITNVAITAGIDLVQLGKLPAGEERTVAVQADVDRNVAETEVSVTITWTWGMVADRSWTTKIMVPVISWGAMLGDAGLPGLEIPNRFVVGEPLAGDQLFSGLFQGRQDHLEHIASAYGSVLPAQPTCFHGIRKVGKSSLLNRVVRQLQGSGRVVVTITAQGLQPGKQDQEAIVANICRRIVKSSPTLFQGIEVPNRVENGVAFLEDFFEVFARVGTKSGDVAPILVIDEFHCLYKAEVGGLLDIFRMNAESRQIGLVFAATEGPSGLPRETSLQLTPRRVDFLTESEVSALVEAVFADTPMVVPDDVRRHLFDACAGHPNFTAAIARRALEAANDGRRNVLCANDIDLAVSEISRTRSEMFETSWFAPDILSDRDRAAAIDLAFTVKEPRGWMDLRDVTARLGEGGKDTLFRLTSSYVLESSEEAGARSVRIRGGILEGYLQMQHGVTLTPSPDPTRASVGIFLDVENLIRGAASPEELVECIERFGNRFGAVQVRVTAATQGALARAGWQPPRVEAAFNAAGWQFRQPPSALANKESIADNVLAPIIAQSAEQYNLAEIILGSGDHSFIPVAQVVVGDGGDDMYASGRRVHALSMRLDQLSGSSPRHPEWSQLAERRFDVCQVLAEDRPDLVLWDLEDVLADPEGAVPVSPLAWPA